MMSYKVALIADNHFLKYAGQYYVNGTYSTQYLGRFTSNFDELVVIARSSEAAEPAMVEKLRLSGGDRVCFCELPDFNGVVSYIRLKQQLKQIIAQSLQDVDAIFVRMPCILTTLAFECAREKNLPVMIDVGADPDSIYRSAKPTLFELLISKYMKSVCQRNCLTANGVSYVTQKVLQKKYPCRAIRDGESVEYFTAAISNADIASDFYTKRTYGDKLKKVKLLHISNNICENSGKGHTEAIEVLRKLVERRIDATITFVGGGDGTDWVKGQADQYGLGGRVTFTGRIADRNEYKEIILSHDIFIFPSHSEGLPRVLLETMATGMVCVSSNVDGIPEILDEADIFRFTDYEGMADRIAECMENGELMNRISARNYEVAQRYSNSQLKLSYDRFYQKVRGLIDYGRK